MVPSKSVSVKVFVQRTADVNKLPVVALTAGALNITVRFKLLELGRQIFDLLQIYFVRLECGFKIDL